MAELKETYNACQGWACHERCLLTTYTNKDGIIERTEKLKVPSHIKQKPRSGSLADRSQICVKGILSGKIPYIKERVKAPLRRAGERGEDKWEEISWDQALTEISQKLIELRDKYGSRSVMINSFPCGLAGNGAPLALPMQLRFQNAFDASMFEWEGVDQVSMKMTGIVAGDTSMVTRASSASIYHSDYVIIWGANPIGYTRAAWTTTALTEIIDEGVKVVDIGILYDTTAAKSSEFVRVVPGTDGPLAMTMANLILQENRIDSEFLTNHTVAPFLVRSDNGKFLRQSDIQEDGEPTNYLIWDTTSEDIRPVAPQVKSFVGITPDLFVEKTINGIACKTALLLLKEHLEPWTPESQELITGVKADYVQTFTQEYLDAQNPLIYLGCGLRYKNSTAAGRAIQLLPVLTGNLHNTASGLIPEPSDDSFPVPLNDFALIFGEIPPVLDNPVAPVRDILASYQNPDTQQYKALITTYANPVHNWPPRELWEKRLLPGLELIVVFEIRHTETTAWADYVLPDTTSYERENVHVRGGCLVLAEPAIEPQGQARDQGEVWIELGQRVGLGQYFNRTGEEFTELKLAAVNNPLIANADPPITLERLRKEKVIQIEVPPVPFNCWRDSPLLTPSGRHEFYIETLSDVPGGALMNHDPALIDDPVRRKDYPLHLFIGRSRYFVQGQLREIPELYKLSGPGPRVGMTAEDALARGIKEGDTVEVYNERGVVKVPVHFTQLIQPGMAMMWYAYKADEFTESDCPIALGANMNIDEAVDPVSNAWGPIFRRQQQGFGMPDCVICVAGEYANETIWDVLCEIRRAD